MNKVEVEGRGRLPTPDPREENPLSFTSLEAIDPKAGHLGT